MLCGSIVTWRCAQAPLQPYLCPALTPIQANDRALAAFWYKDDQVTPFYMVDGRTSTSIELGKHRQLSNLGNRSTFNVSLNPAVLYVDVETKEDAGTYVCRVDSYRSLTRTSTVKLIVLSPTPKLLIYEGETLLSDVAGPYKEGSDLELTCELTGGDGRGPHSGAVDDPGPGGGLHLQSAAVREDPERLPDEEPGAQPVDGGGDVRCRQGSDSTQQPFLAAAVQVDLFCMLTLIRLLPFVSSVDHCTFPELEEKEEEVSTPLDITAVLL
ncbi:uncharacterized protein CEXT_495341 [Caerostris extrusa]|uniref:Ig-like domain-containing protein n=1 Tax=Caerostris extrusa TaxID=172846 RepID=A0AAV4QK41_CAEEX|nr:uncharacterized protein CEXT_495341 [Caerostris extrusa]